MSWTLAGVNHADAVYHLQMMNRWATEAWRRGKSSGSCGSGSSSGPASESGTAPRDPSSSAMPAAPSGSVPAALPASMVQDEFDDIPDFTLEIAAARAAEAEAAAAAALEAAAAADAMAAKLIAEEEETAAKKQAKREAAATAAKAAKQKRQGEQKKKQQQQAGKQVLKGGQLQHTSKLDYKATTAAASAPPPPSVPKSKTRTSSSSSSSRAVDTGAAIAPAAAAAAAATPSVPGHSRSIIPGKSVDQVGGLDVYDLEVSRPPPAACGGVGVVPAGAAFPECLISASSRWTGHLLHQGAAGPEGQAGGFHTSRASGALSSAEGLGILSSRTAGAAGKVRQGDQQDTAAAALAALAMGGDSRAISRRPPIGVGRGEVAGAADVGGAGETVARTAVGVARVLTAEQPAATAGGKGGGLADGTATVDGAFGNHRDGGGGSGLRTAAAAASGGDGDRGLLQWQLPSNRGSRQPQKDASVREPQQLQQAETKKSSGKPSKRPTTCVVCWESTPCVVLLPCKHLVLCEACSKMMEGKGAECPMCRAPVEQHMMIFSA